MNGPESGREDITPPSSLCGPPPTPPLTDEKEARDATSIVQQLEKLRYSNRDPTIHHVGKRLWTALQPLLEQTNLRVDYFPWNERLVLRMPNLVHNMFLRRLGRRITEQLRLLSHESGPAADFAGAIEDIGSTTIKPRDPAYGTHDPDSSYQHLQSPSPTVVIEIAHSQRKKDLRTLADDYILGSDALIRVMVGVKIEYRKNKRATFSIWRAESQGSGDDTVWVATPTVADQVFRNDDGTPNSDKTLGLRLALEEFADTETCQQFGDINRDIFVSCEELYQDLEKAERLVKTTESKMPERNPRMKKRPRTQTPEEQLDARDENAFAEEEERVAKRQELDDVSYGGSSP